MASLNLDKDDIAWVKAHAAAVTEAFEGEFNAARDRFNQGQLLLDRFNVAIETVLKSGKGHFSALDEAHNEICIASALLANTRLRFIRLEYEPPLPGCAKTIDFRATADTGQIAYVDVKTIKPQAADRVGSVRESDERWLDRGQRARGYCRRMARWGNLACVVCREGQDAGVRAGTRAKDCRR